MVVSSIKETKNSTLRLYYKHFVHMTLVIVSVSFLSNSFTCEVCNSHKFKLNKQNYFFFEYLKNDREFVCKSFQIPGAIFT